MKAKKPTAEEARGRRFAALMESEWNFTELTVRQAEQVISMAGALRVWMAHREKDLANSAPKVTQ